MKTRGYCGMHYERLRRHGSTADRPRRGKDAEYLAAIRPAVVPRAVICRHPGRKHYAKGLCEPCYMTQWAKKHPEANTGTTWLKNHPERAQYHKRKAHLKKHGITPERYEEMWAEQEGCCANPRCLAPFRMRAPDFRAALPVDHDHETGQVRGLLCHPCNAALGNARDNIERLLGLAEYLAGFD